MKTTVSSKGIVLQSGDRIKPGQEFDVERFNQGNADAIGWLLACPQKEFFVPIDSESTDTL